MMSEERGREIPEESFITHEHELHPQDPEQEVDDVHVPYWWRAHHDWRFLAVVALMLAAMATYVLTLGLAVRPGVETLPLLDTSGQ
jgi:hypothetical protein